MRRARRPGEQRWSASRSHSAGGHNEARRLRPRGRARSEGECHRPEGRPRRQARSHSRQRLRCWQLARPGLADGLERAHPPRGRRHARTLSPRPGSRLDTRRALRPPPARGRLPRRARGPTPRDARLGGPRAPRHPPMRRQARGGWPDARSTSPPRRPPTSRVDAGIRAGSRARRRGLPARQGRARAGRRRAPRSLGRRAFASSRSSAEATSRTRWASSGSRRTRSRKMLSTWCVSGSDSGSGSSPAN